jgi:hypothetical protein
MPVADLGYYVVLSAKGKKANEIKGLRVIWMVADLRFQLINLKSYCSLHSLGLLGLLGLLLLDKYLISLRYLVSYLLYK